MSADSDIAVLTLQLARDPSSLVFLTLGETLRRGGDLESALSVAENGVAWYPEMAGAWDLLARVQSDRGQGDLAFDAWTTVLRFDPEHAGAHKGLAFLAFRSGEWDRSVRHLRRALDLNPDEPGLQEVLARVTREAVRHAIAAAAASPLSAPGVAGQALLVDLHGQLLEGRLVGADDDPRAAVGAALAGLSRDAERTSRLLGLGPWRSMSLSGRRATLEIRSPTIDSLLILRCPAALRPADAALDSDRLAERTRRWLESLQ